MATARPRAEQRAGADNREEGPVAGPVRLTRERVGDDLRNMSRVPAVFVDLAGCSVDIGRFRPSERRSLNLVVSDLRGKAHLLIRRAFRC